MQAQTKWAFAFWKGRPAIWSEVAAYSFEDGGWVPVSSSEVGTEGLTRTKALLEVEFGDLTDLPPFPVKEVDAAFVLEKKRLHL